jgi:hypothetical protein
MKKETLRMQMLAGLITESQYKQKLNEAMFSVGDMVDLGDVDMGEGKIILVTDYESHADEIDNDIEEGGWESSTPREELTWYKIQMEDGEIYWSDEEELSAFN